MSEGTEVENAQEQPEKRHFWRWDVGVCVFVSVWHTKGNLRG